MWKFDKSTDPSSVDDGPKTYTPVSPGRHHARFISAMKQKSSGGFDQYIFKMEIVSQPDLRKTVIYRLTLSEKAEIFAKRAWMAANHDFPVDFFDVDSVKQCFLGRVVVIEVTQREWSGKVRAQVERIYRKDADIPHEDSSKYWNNPVFGKVNGASPSKGSWDDSEDDIPF